MSAALAEFVLRHPRLFVLTGAGCSTDSGIPDYRNPDGAWKRSPPVDYQSFIGQHAVRQRYWARSLIGWRHFGRAAPNPAHLALSALEAQGRIHMLVTQNVDGLHQAAGQRRVIDLHGRIDQVRCLGCAYRVGRAQHQQTLVAANPRWAALDAQQAPDGDADLNGVDFGDFQVPECPQCGGTLKPDVVFFGENVPRARVQQAFDALESSDAILVVGSSLMVLSGLRFVRAAAQSSRPVAAINLGITRGDELISLKISESCATALTRLTEHLAASAPPRGI